MPSYGDNLHPEVDGGSGQVDAPSDGTSSSVGGDHCPTGFHCSLLGNNQVVGAWGAGTPLGVAGQPSLETVPVCLADSGAGAHDRRGGAACSANGDCVSQL